MTIEKVSQEEMLTQFTERMNNLLEENKSLSKKIRDNEVTALKLQGAIETLQYYSETPQEEETMSHPPEEEVTETE
ncbi:hypothetical protein AAJ62_gp090 [Synechococcus phage ACG-2014g]|jgi:hypothetical protein|uniref:Uncharacterized protein n=1 Tax=Synechococcus phage ACG-2014g TaxID=1493512 RepID=A0A0E3FDJ1_9CAUD|nr:hypothetical protein AAJ62_gp090 [Synechococcus phage ACG-2014g]AIX24434.1 hypothetical protein Syn7803US105_90 [Synechococcus phage ACG-2014g]